MRNFMKQSKAITLIALVITIIVLLILAGVTIATLTGDNGLLTKATDVKKANEKATLEEKIKLAYSEYELESKTNPNADIENITRSSLEKAFNNENITTKKEGNSLKITFNDRNKEYKYLANGKIIELLPTTDIYGKLDENNNTLYLRATKINDNYSLLDTQYKQISLKWNSDSIKKVIIEEPIAPAPERLYLFKDCTKLELIENIKNLHTENAKSLYCMFQNCSLLKEIDVSHFDTSLSTATRDMFNGCSSLTNIDVSGFDTSLVTDMGWMFCGCENLLNLDLSNFDTKNTFNLYSFIHGCKSLETIDFSSFDTSNVTSMIQIFTNCKSLKKIIFGRNFIINSGTNCSYAFTGVTKSNIKVIAYRNNVEMIKTKFYFNNTNFEKILD